MMKQWLMRRAVRMPDVAGHDGAHQFVGVQAALHQRLGRACSDQLDRLGGRVVAVLRVDESAAPLMSRFRLCRDRPDARCGTDKDRRRSGRSFAASTALAKETSSQGCATAVLIGGTFCAAAIRRRYFCPCRLSIRSSAIVLPSLLERAIGTIGVTCESGC